MHTDAAIDPVFEKNFYLFAGENSQEGIDIAREYIEFHGYTRDEVKITKDDNGVYVVTKKPLRLK